MKLHKAANSSTESKVATPDKGTDQPDLSSLFSKPTAPPTEVAPKTTKVEEFVEQDKKDAEQIIEKENTGQIVSNDWFYEVDREDQDGKIYVGFKPTYVGVIKCMQVQGNLEVVGLPLPEHTASKFIYTVQVKDTVRGISLYGQGFCNKMENGIISQYAQVVALSIAQRNAYDKLIDLEIKNKVLHEWYEAKHGKETDMSSIIVVSGDALKDIKGFINSNK